MLFRCVSEAPMAWDTKPAFFSPFLFSPLYTVSPSLVHSHFLFPFSLLSSLLIYGSMSHKSAFFFPSFLPSISYLLSTQFPLIFHSLLTSSLCQFLFSSVLFPIRRLRHCFRNSKIPRQSLLFLLHIAPPVPECH